MNERDGFNFGANRADAGRRHDVDDFIKSRTRGAKDDDVITEKHLKDAGHLTLWLHTKAPLEQRWCHQWWRRVRTTPKDGGREEWRVFFQRLNSHEVNDDVLIYQEKRKNGVRRYPPERCAFGKLCELVYQAVRDERLSWLEPLVRFDADRKDETRIVHAVDFYGGCGYQAGNLSEEEVEEAKRAGVDVFNGWRQSLLATARFAFYVVDDEAPENKVFDAGDYAGNNLKRAIEGECKRYDPAWRPGDKAPIPERANFRLNPYPFRFEYVEKVGGRPTKGRDKWPVSALAKAPTTEILELIRDEEPADASDLVAKYDPAELRASIEEHVVTPKLLLPLLDQAFPPRDPARARAQEPTVGDRFAAAAAKAEVERQAAQAPPAQLFECEHCREECMRAEDSVCPKCGATYDMAQLPPALLTRPCSKCGEQVKLAALGEEVTCGRCGAVHAESEVPNPKHDADPENEPACDRRWNFVRLSPPPTAPAAPAPARRRGRRPADAPAG